MKEKLPAKLLRVENIREDIKFLVFKKGTAWQDEVYNIYRKVNKTLVVLQSLKDYKEISKNIKPHVPLINEDEDAVLILINPKQKKNEK